MNIESITPARLSELLGRHPVNLIDVRSPAEFAQIHAAGAVNVPLDRLDPAQLAQRFDPGHNVYVICKSGARSLMAVHRLHHAGYQHVVNVHGGTDAWIAARLPIAHGS